MADEVTGTVDAGGPIDSPADQRNLQFNPGGDPAREKQFLEEQQQKTGEFGRAAQPQLVSAETPAEIVDAIRGADVLDTEVEKAGYDAPDAPAGSEQGANVNAEFEENVRTGADASGDAGGDTPVLDEKRSKK